MLHRITLPVAFFSLLTASLRAQTYTWTGGTGTWSNAASWGGTVPNATDVTASLGGTAGTITLDASYTVGNLTFGSSGSWTIAGNSTTLLALSTSSGAPTITNNNTSTNTYLINVGLAGTQGFTKAGSGGVKLGGTGGTLTGTINVTGGNLTITSDGAIGSGANIVVASGAAFYANDSNAGDTLTNSVTLNGATMGVGTNARYNGTITLGGNSTITHGSNGGYVSGTITTTTNGNYTLTLATSSAGQPDLVVNSAIQSGGGGNLAVNVSGSGTTAVELAGVNTYSGSTAGVPKTEPGGMLVRGVG